MSVDTEGIEDNLTANDYKQVGELESEAASIENELFKQLTIEAFS
jgi:hypothetical protein